MRIALVRRLELPFQVVNIDFIGSIDPKMSLEHKYVLTLVDEHTRWAEAIPFEKLIAKSTCEALFQIFTRMGIPILIPSDNVKNFNSDLTKEFEKLLCASSKCSAPQYTQSGRIVEHFN